MPIVTMNVKTYVGSNFPASERLVCRFVPLSAATGATFTHPLREEKRVVPADGQVSVPLVATTRLTPATGYKVRFEWFDKHPVKDEWTLRGSSELDGVLNVPAEGGDVVDLLGGYPLGSAVVFLGYGLPPSWIPSGGVYYNLSSTEGSDIYSDGVVV